MKKDVIATAEGQLRLQQDADRRLRERYRHFAEIQAGPNPLTREELARLAEKHPERWGIFAPRP